MTTPSVSKRACLDVLPRPHGLGSRFALLPGETADEFNAFLTFFLSAFCPVTEEACFAALNGAIAAFMIRRANRIEASLDAGKAPEEKTVAARRLERHRISHRAALGRALTVLQKARPQNR
jgi:hypothetical protein